MISRVLKVFSHLSYAVQYLFLIINTLIFLFISGFAHAQTFADLESALMLHPQLQTLIFQADSERALAKSSLALPDPVVSLGINNFPIFDPSFDEFLPSNKALGVQQTFPNKASRKSKALIQQANAVQNDELHAQLFAAMRGELIALLHNKERIKKQRDFSNQRAIKYALLIDAVESEVDAGQSSLFSLAEIESERIEVIRTLANLNAEARQVDARLIYLLGLVPDVVAPIIEPMTWSGDSSSFVASRVASASLDISYGEVEYAKSQWKAEWGAQVAYQQREAGRDFAGDDWMSAMVTFTVPFWAKKSQKPKLDSAKAIQRARQSSLENVQRQVVAQYSSYKAAYTASLNNKDALEKKINAIQGQISAQKRRYESASIFYGPVIKAEIVMLELRSEIATENERASVLAAQINALMVTK